VRRLLAPLLAVAALAPTSVATSAQSPASGAQRETALEAALVTTINGVRREHGLKPFAGSVKLSKAATQHTREMGVVGYFEHESFDSTPFWKRIARWYGSKNWRLWSVGENLVYSSPISRRAAVEMWLNSPEHRANMLSRTWREIGISAIHFDAAPGEYDGQAGHDRHRRLRLAPLVSPGHAAPGRGSRPGSHRRP
jgi:uncharacterized protein YkwD